jgi:MYXO-CTERM domain-containing protein
MRAFPVLSGLLLLGLLAGACSSGAPTAQEAVHSTSEAITAACNTLTVGFPCDPDGPIGPALECEGVCALGTNGTAQCLTLKAAGVTSMDGLVCGNTGGIGDAACARHCLGKTCLVGNAPAGAGCRPTSSNTPCDGQCDGAGTCSPIDNACQFGRIAQLCRAWTCDLTNATVCLGESLLPQTTCSRDSQCLIGTCDSGGSCIPGNQKGCDDGNPCTDDSCDPQTGGCIGTPNDNNACSDNDVCTVGDHCSNGVCKSGTQHPTCDDGDPCTDDSCDYVIGCNHTTRCWDNNICTTDACDPNTGACSNPPIDCSDQDPCTTDSCNYSSGCQHVFTPSDACSTATGGTGGTGAGGTAGTGGTADTGGTVGTGGTADTGGTLGTGETGGAVGTGETGGTADTAGTGGTAGSSAAGSATTGGEAGASVAGTSAGGSGAHAGAGGSAGAHARGGSGGMESMSGSGGSGGAGVIGNAGAPSLGDSGAPDTTGSKPSSSDNGGCGCRTASSRSTPNVAFLAIAGLAFAALRRRRRS